MPMNVCGMKNTASPEDLRAQADFIGSILYFRNPCLYGEEWQLDVEYWYNCPCSCDSCIKVTTSYMRTPPGEGGHSNTGWVLKLP